MIEECFEKAKEVVRKNIFSHGIFASPGYDAIWSRDSMITLSGASLIEDEKIKKAFERSLLTLARHQSKLGQIPNAVDKYSKRNYHVDFKSIDSSLWFIIGGYNFKKRYGKNLKLDKHFKKALTWLEYQDTGEDGMPEQQPTSDWQDAFPHRYGHTINTQALYYQVLRLSKMSTSKLKKAVHGREDGLWSSNYYIPWRWKNHNEYSECGEWFDSLGNLLAIIYGLADENKSNKILKWIESKKINRPYPIRTIYPAIEKKSKDWKDYFLDSDAGKPYSYSNGGIWTFIGGFYVLALVKMGKLKKAKVELEKLAEANLLEPGFAEWIHPKTKETFGDNQAWNAGMYIAAYQSVKKKKCLF